MQHLGEICTEQRSCGKSKQNKNHVKPRKEIQKRSFWRRFFSSFLSLLKEKRPPEAKRRTDSHASDVGHWLGMTPLRGVRGGQSRPPLRMSNEGAVVGWRGDAPQGYLFRFAPLRGHRPLRKVYRGCGGKTAGGAEPLPYGQVQGVRPCNGRRGVVTPPYGGVQGGAVVGWRGDAPQGCLFRFAPLRGHRPLRKVSIEGGFV